LNERWKGVTEVSLRGIERLASAEFRDLSPFVLTFNRTSGRWRNKPAKPVSNSNKLKRVKNRLNVIGNAPKRKKKRRGGGLW